MRRKVEGLRRDAKRRWQRMSATGENAELELGALEVVNR